MGIFQNGNYSVKLTGVKFLIFFSVKFDLLFNCDDLLSVLHNFSLPQFLEGKLLSTVSWERKVETPLRDAIMPKVSKGKLYLLIRI